MRLKGREEREYSARRSDLMLQKLSWMLKVVPGGILGM